MVQLNHVGQKDSVRKTDLEQVVWLVRPGGQEQKHIENGPRLTAL